MDEQLRPLQYRIEDIRDDMEGERLIRTELLDQAALARTAESISRAGTRGRTSGRILEGAMEATQLAQLQVAKIRSLLETGKSLKQGVRDMNRFLVAIMQGETAQGQESFSDSLTGWVSVAYTIPESGRQLIALYIALVYGDQNAPRRVPFVLAINHAPLFSAEKMRITSHLAAEEATKQAAFRQDYFNKKMGEALDYRQYDKARRAKEEAKKLIEKGEAILAKVTSYYTWVRDKSWWDENANAYARSRYVNFVWLQCFPELESILGQYYTRRFVPRQRRRLGNLEELTTCVQERLDSKYWKHRYPPDPNYVPFLKRNVVDSLLRFYALHGESAFVVLSMLLHGCTGGGLNIYEADCYYFSWCAASFPEIEGVDPIEVLWHIQQINDFTWENRKEFIKRCLAYFNFRDYERREDIYRYTDGRKRDEQGVINAKSYGLKKARFPIDDNVRIDMLEDIYRRKDVTFLRSALKEYGQWSYRELGTTTYSFWDSLSEFTKGYLLARACDLVLLGEKVADVTFPSPNLSVYKAIVAALTRLYEYKKGVVEEEETRKWRDREKRIIEKRCEEEVKDIKCLVPVNIVERVLTREERASVLTALEREFAKNEPVKAMLELIRQFAIACERLRNPDNHIKVRTGQFVERQVNTRTFADMEVEMAWELVNLPKHTAYVKITQEQEGKQVVVKRKIRTYRLPSVPKGRDAQAMEKAILQQNYSLYYKKRRDIEEEIAQRQQKQLAPNSDSSPPTHIGGSQDPSPLAAIDTPPQGALLPGGDSPDPDAPPPPGFSNPTAAEMKEPVKPKTKSNPRERNLIYRSNFSLSDGRWTEKETTGARKFRRDGYYHIELNRSYTTVELIEIPLTDFRVHVDAQVLKGETVIYGVCFRCSQDRNGLSFYLFALTPKSWGLLLYRNRDYNYLLDYRSSEFIKGGGINSLMVQMVGQEITLGINGHILATPTDNRLTSGYVGLVVRKEGDAPVETRFCNFRLYSFE